MSAKPVIRPWGEAFASSRHCDDIGFDGNAFGDILGHGLWGPFARCRNLLSPNNMPPFKDG